MGKMPSGFGGAGNMSSMMRQAQKMQSDMQKFQQELEQKVFDVSAGGGVVAIKINGQKQILGIKLSPEIVDPNDIDMLEDILTAAVNEAIRTVEEFSASEMKKITGGLNLGGIL